LLSALLIALREGVEASLVVGIVLVYLSRTGRAALARFVWYGVAAATALSLAVAVALDHWRISQDGFEGLLLVIPLWVILALAITGLALALAALQVFIRDVEHILMPVLMILMYLTPILYPLSLVPDSVKPWVAANPFGYLVDRLRDALLEGRLAVGWGDAVAVVVALGIFAAGRWMFLRLSPHFEDFV